jgi:hypothetical protein
MQPVLHTKLDVKLQEKDVLMYLDCVHLTMELLQLVMAMLELMENAKEMEQHQHHVHQRSVLKPQAH